MQFSLPPPLNPLLPPNVNTEAVCRICISLMGSQGEELGIHKTPKCPHLARNDKFETSIHPICFLVSL